MDIVPSLIFYIIFVILICLTAIRWKIKIWSSIMMALILGQVALCVICPPSETDNENGDPSSSASAFYMLIQFGTPILAIFYILNTCWKDVV